MGKTLGSLVTLALCAGLGLTGCEDDNASGSGTNTQDAGPADAPKSGADAGARESDAAADSGAAESPDKSPVYVVATRVFTPDGTQTNTYVQTLSSIEQGAKLETSKAREFAGPAELFALEKPRWLAIGDGEAPLLTHYTLGSDEMLTAGDEISLQDYGLQSFFSNKLYQVSPTKAYIPDPDTAQLVAIDPSDLSVLGSVELKDTEREGYTPVYSYGAVNREGKLLFAVAWFDWENDKVLPETGLVVLDTKTDEVLRVDVDKRCAGITQPITLPSGDTYFPSSALAAAAYHVKRLDIAPCALRVKAGADAFDSDYEVKLSELTDGALAGEPIPTGKDEIFLRVFDESLAKVEAGAASWDVTGQAAWRFRRWNPATDKVTSVDNVEPSTADTAWFQVDDRIFHSQTKSDYSSTQLIELNAKNGPKPALTSPGLISGLGRVR